MTAPSPEEVLCECGSPDRPHPRSDCRTTGTCPTCCNHAPGDYPTLRMSQNGFNAALLAARAAGRREGLEEAAAIPWDRPHEDAHDFFSHRAWTDAFRLGTERAWKHYATKIRALLAPNAGEV